ncbi:MAG: hypothetical protein UR98_C0040G0015 [Parcubacteria group bacterium GW2011_GWA1_36_12]|nr:MAG: hypothetical protein UR98_C0040G0015 [Parcubacteria group bacterium GW2011_GWA1_36_12]
MAEVRHKRKETLKLRSIELTLLAQECQTNEWDRTKALGILAQCDNKGFVKLKGHRHQIRRVTYESGGQDSLSHDITFDQYSELGRPHIIELEADYILRPTQ